MSSSNFFSRRVPPIYYQRQRTRDVLSRVDESTRETFFQIMDAIKGGVDVFTKGYIDEEEDTVTTIRCREWNNPKFYCTHRIKKTKEQKQTQCASCIFNTTNEWQNQCQYQGQYGGCKKQACCNKNTYCLDHKVIEEKRLSYGEGFEDAKKGKRKREVVEKRQDHVTFKITDFFN